MSYAIVGFGAVGQALAHAFAHKNIGVTVASRRPPEALTPQARAIGPAVVAKSLRDALEADTIILAVPFGEHREVAKALPSWKGKTVIDAMNALVPLEEPDGLPSSAFVAKSFAGAKFVKGFNHLIAATLAADPVVEGGHPVVFLSGDDEDATAPVAALAKQLGSHPSSWESSTRVARWCTHAAALGVSSSSRIYSGRSSNRRMGAVRRAGRRPTERQICGSPRIYRLLSMA
jgi:8-hydroxy-5-deazaflavin:NADPH oxidoreductase